MAGLLEEYQRNTGKTAIYPDESGLVIGTDLAALMYLGLKLAGEAGEVSEKIGKLYRDNTQEMGDQLSISHSDWNALGDDVEKELGDVMWYISQICNKLGLSLRQVLLTNQRKLELRKLKGTIKGSGDDR